MNTKPLLVGIPEGTRVTGLSRSRIYELLDTGAIESRKIGRRRLLVYSSLERLAAGEAADKAA